jgi:O-methyltransferase
MFGFALRSRVEKWKSAREFRRIYSASRDFTMMSEQLFCANLSLSKMIENVDGCIVECGVWRGGMSAGLFRVLGSNRRYFLFDSFEGLPPAQEIDGVSAIEYQKNTDSPTYFDNCSAPIEYAERAMRSSGCDQFELRKGFFSETLPEFDHPEPIALLRLDGDWYESTMTCLTHLFNRVAERGIIIIDDYYTWDGCSRAVHDFLSSNKLTERILMFEGPVCYLIKQNAHSLSENERNLR